MKFDYVLDLFNLPNPSAFWSASGKSARFIDFSLIGGGRPGRAKERTCEKARSWPPGKQSLQIFDRRLDVSLTVKRERRIRIPFWTQFFRLLRKWKFYMIDQTAKGDALLNHEPHICELVFAKYAVDGREYRAKAVELFSLDCISVFYVDYGNRDTLKIDQLRYWDDRFDCLPFQAVHCRVANIKPLKQNHPKAINQFRRAPLVMDHAGAIPA
ncbi:hypothetical protein quinque_008886 [Culex quinquefasciatus]